MMKALAVASLLSSAAAHIVMANPAPFTAEYMATSPLASDGSNFPCQYKDASSYEYAVMNDMVVGEDHLLSFNGSASHGGGTCQLAVTMDTAPTKSSVWKNILVLEGGCPVDGTGNDGTKTFNFQIPAGFPNGRATLGWVWNNRIGNREIYMSCAPIDVSGGSDDGKAYYESLPDLYLVNMPPSDCTIAENENLLIPNPGQFVVKDTSAPGTFADATGPKCAAGGSSSSSGSDSGSSSGGAASSANSAATSPATTASSYGGYPLPTTTALLPANKGAATTTGSAPTVMSFVTIATSAPNSYTPVASPTTAAPAAATTSVDVSTATYAASAPTSSSSGSSAGTAATSSSLCTDANDGQVVCNGESQFGLCNRGSVVWQAVSAGTTCTNGQVVKKREEKEESTEGPTVHVGTTKGKHPHGPRRY